MIIEMMHVTKMMHVIMTTMTTIAISNSRNHN
jgi:hypothetical protein